MEQNEEKEDVISELLARAEDKGDLPIFNASLNNVRRLSSDPESCATQLAQIIMKDTNLSVKLLRIANSPLYARGPVKISSVSRAVVLLGFDVIKNLCLTLKLIESFQDENPTVGMHRMVARSYLTGGMVRDVALKSAMKNPEETYVCGLCHNLGEIAVGYFMPEKFNEIVQLYKEADISWVRAQERILGVSFGEAGQELAKSWNFSNKLINSMADYKPELEGPVRSTGQLSHAIVSLSSQAVDSLYLSHERSNKGITHILNQLEEATGIKTDKLELSLTDAFHQSCELIHSYGLSPTILQPGVNESGDVLRDKLARDLTFHASSQAESPSAGTEGLCEGSVADKNDHIDVNEQSNEEGMLGSGGDDAPVVERGDPVVQLAYIQEITTLVSEDASLSTLFLKILQGLNQGSGFDRCLLCLVTPDRKAYASRIAVGDEEGVLNRAISGKINPDGDLFSRIIEEGSELLVDDACDGSWRGVIDPEFVEKAGTNSFIVAGIKRDAKPIGFFYADNGLTQTEITPSMRRSFLQFITQARFAVQVVN